MTVDMPETDPLIGQMLSERYLVERNLTDSGSESGGIGVVYLAKDQKLLGRDVAVKLLRGESLENPDLRRKFEHEKEALIRLDHPGIVRILDYGISVKGDAYIVMDHVPGLSLRKLLKMGALAPETTAEIILQTAEALAAAHDNNILHRDVKPENIMLTPTKDGHYKVRLIDFGIARISDPKLAPVTDTSRPIGTVLYMSPEQLLGSENLSSAVDIYALAIVVFEMLTGRRPFLPKSAAEMYKLASDGINRSQLEVDGISKATSQLIASALSFRPEERPSDIREFGQNLANAIADGGYATHEIEINAPIRRTFGIRPELAETNTFVPAAQKTSKLSVPKLVGASTLIFAAIVSVFFLIWPNGSEPQRTSPAGFIEPSNRTSTAENNFSGPPINDRTDKSSDQSATIGSDGQDNLTPSATNANGADSQRRDDPNRRPAGVESPFGIELEMASPGDQLRSTRNSRTGINTLLKSGDKFRMVLRSDRDGYVYLFNQGADASGRIGFRLLFPTLNINGNSATILAGKEIQTASNSVDNNPGVEIIWAIWSPLPLNDLNEIWRSHLDKRFPVSQEHAAVINSYIDLGSLSFDGDSNSSSLVFAGRDGTVIHRYLIEHR